MILRINFRIPYLTPQLLHLLFNFLTSFQKASCHVKEDQVAAVAHRGHLLLPNVLLLNKLDLPQPRHILQQEQIKPALQQLHRLRNSKVLLALVSSDRWQVPLRMYFPNSPKNESWPNDIRGVAVGSSIGHAIGGFFGGGSSQPAEQQQQDNGAVATQGQSEQSNNWGARSCETDAKQFTKCLDENQGNMQICGWYLEQLVS